MTICKLSSVEIDFDNKDKASFSCLQYYFHGILLCPSLGKEKLRLNDARDLISSEIVQSKENSKSSEGR